MSSTRLCRRWALRSMMSTNRTAARGIVERAGAQRLGRRADRGDRRAQLVRRIRDEVATKRLEPAQLGDVDEDDQDALVVARQGRRVHEQPARLEAGQLDLGRRGAVRLARVLEQVVELRSGAPSR